MKLEFRREVSLSEVHGSIDTGPRRSWWRQLFMFSGPAYLVSVGYMDPGNWATDLAGGSRYGYALIWVLLMSNGMALVLQYFSAKLGIVRGRDLAQANREAYPRRINYILYGLAEIAIAACDLAEVLGMAIGIQLLTGLPLVYGVTLTILDTFLLLFLQRLGMRKMEAFILGLIAVVGISFLVEILLARPNLGEVARGIVPSLPGSGALYVAIGIIGATVMPHNLYLHSALVQTRKIQTGDRQVKHAIRMNLLDSSLALNLAFLVNAAILVLAATVFFKTGRTSIASIRDAYLLLGRLLGHRFAPTLFAIALIAAGQSSTLTGTLAGQIVMEGYLQLRINPVLRRLLTRLLAILPALLVILIAGESQVDNLMVFSQVVLSVQLGFAVIPLIHFVSDRKKMGSFAIGPAAQVLGWVIAVLLIYLNLKLVLDSLTGYFSEPGHLIWKLLLSTALVAGLLLLFYLLVHPWLSLRGQPDAIRIHPQTGKAFHLHAPSFEHVAIALDFSEHDEKLLAYAIGQGSRKTRFLLIHVVESVSAQLLGKESDDYETRQDEQTLQSYQAQLQQLGWESRIRLGYRHRTQEIVRIVREEHADMLVIGAHGHSGIQDFIFGETVNSVRHELQIPVLIVHL